MAPGTLTGNDSWIWSVACSPQEQGKNETLLPEMIASGSEDGTIHLWNLPPLAISLRDRNRSTSQPRCLTGHSHAVWSVAFSPDGRILASGSLDGTLRLWNPTTGNCWQVLQKHHSGIWSVAFSPKHRSAASNHLLLASGSQDQTIELWKICFGVASTGTEDESPTLLVQPLRTLTGHTGWIRCVAFSPDGEMLASGSSDGVIKLWQVETGRCLQTFKAHSSLVLAITFSPDGQYLATGGGDGTLKLWNRFLLRNHEAGEDDRISPYLPLLHTLEGHQKWVRFLAYSPDGTLLASCSHDGTIRLWDSSSGQCLAVLRVPRPYEGTNITGIRGLTEAQKETLRILGAVEFVK